MSSSAGRSVRLFLVDGSPTGLITAEIMNWTGHLLVVPRSRMADAIKREETDRTGIYFLLGDDPDQPSIQRIYIGEADCVSDRLKMHAKDENKEFWTRACLVTSKDQNLTKAHARYLEFKMIEICRQAGRANLANGTSPTTKLLPESDIADMEFFIEQIQVVLPVLGFDFLKPQASRETILNEKSKSESVSIVALELNHSSGLHAEAALDGEEVTVFRGSTANTQEYATNHYHALRQNLIEEKKLTPKIGTSFLEFSHDVSFNSPSAASCVVLNRNDNGRTSWRIKGTGKTLKEWEAEQLDLDSNS